MLLLILSLKLCEGATISHGAEDVGNRGLGAGGSFLGGGTEPHPKAQAWRAATGAVGRST